MAPYRRNTHTVLLVTLPLAETSLQTFSSIPAVKILARAFTTTVPDTTILFAGGSSVRILPMVATISTYMLLTIQSTISTRWDLIGYRISRIFQQALETH